MERKKKSSRYRSVNVREARDHFSDLVREASQGAEITITWHGTPRARLCKAEPNPSHGFRVDWEWLRRLEAASGMPLSEDIIRQERDARD